MRLVAVLTNVGWVREAQPDKPLLAFDTRHMRQKALCFSAFRALLGCSQSAGPLSNPAANGAMAHGRGVAHAGLFDLGLCRVKGQLH